MTKVVRPTIKLPSAFCTSLLLAAARLTASDFRNAASVWVVLAIMTVGRLTECEYEYVHHQAFAKRIGVQSEQVERLAAWETDPAFNEQERAVIRYATEVTQNVRVADATFDALRKFFDAEQIVELTLNTGFYNMVVRFLLPMQVDLEPDARKQS